MVKLHATNFVANLKKALENEYRHENRHLMAALRSDDLAAGQGCELNCDYCENCEINC